LACWSSPLIKGEFCGISAIVSILRNVAFLCLREAELRRFSTSRVSCVYMECAFFSYTDERDLPVIRPGAGLPILPVPSSASSFVTDNLNPLYLNGELLALDSFVMLFSKGLSPSSSGPFSRTFTSFYLSKFFLMLAYIS